MKTVSQGNVKIHEIRQVARKLDNNRKELNGQTNWSDKFQY